MNGRGYSVIALDNPKDGENVGGAQRAASIYGAALIVLGGHRPRKLIEHPTDTTKAWRHTPLILSEYVLDCLPHDCVAVAVDLLPGAQLLPAYKHPERAFYIFGPEDGTLGPEITDHCRDVVMVPTRWCMNLAATVNVVLYDRMAKEGR